MSESSTPALDLAEVCSLVKRGLTPLLGAELSVELGYPAIAATSKTRAQIPVAIISLGIGHTTTPSEATLVLDAALATNLVDRSLSGRGKLGIATAAALPSEAECGVLAYLTAKLIKPFDGLWVRNVFALNEAPAGQGVTWPIALRWQDGAGVAWLDWPREHGRTVPCELGWFDRLSERDLADLAVGDVLISDRCSLSLTTEGVSGPCLLRANGVHAVLHALLDGAQLRSHRVERAPPRVQGAFLVLSEARVTCHALAAISSSEGATWPGPPIGPARLVCDDRERARGTWVRVDGCIGMRIDALT